MTSAHRVFRVPFHGRSLLGDLLYGEGGLHLLVLHGAGQSHRGRFRQIRLELLDRGIGSAAFDFVGHGETGGDLRASSLMARTEQACRVIEALPLGRPLAIMAASMSGYTAVRLLERYAVDRLILLMPAMYAAKAYAVPFNGGFTEIIRRPGSWEDSDAWAILGRYTGRLLVVAGQRDTVIPWGVIRRVHDAAVQARDRLLFVAPEASHNALTDLRARDPRTFQRLLGLMAKLMGGAPDPPAPRDAEGCPGTRHPP